MQQGQGQVKPQMDTLVVDHIRREVFNRAKDCPNRSELPARLSDPVRREGEQSHGIIQFCGMIAGKVLGQNQENIGAGGESVRQPDAVLPEIEGNQSNTQAVV
jgi:hypothetical protein